VRGGLLSKRALLIQRLEGSRPHGSLCTLNGSARVQRSAEDAEIGVFFRFGEGIEQRRLVIVRQVRAQPIADREFQLMRDKESASVPVHVGRARMGTGVHAGHLSG